MQNKPLPREGGPRLSDEPEKKSIHPLSPDKIIEEETRNIKGKKGGGGHRSLATGLTSGKNVKKTAAETIFKAISLKLDLMKGVKSKRHNYTKLTSAGKNPAKKSPNASEALGAAYASGKMTENSVDADTNTETGATGKPKGSVADQYT